MNDKLFPDLMALIDSGMLAQATVRIQARQMLALESMAEILEGIEALLANPPIVVAQHDPSLDRYGIDPNGKFPEPELAEAIPVGPATGHEPGAASRRRRRGGDLG